MTDRSDGSRGGLSEGDVAELMATLAESRDVFHSEADFQFSFAWEAQRNWPDVVIRLERPRANGSRREYIDLEVERDGRTVLVEFKYFTAAWSGRSKSTGEEIRLRSQAAADLARLHFVHDLSRLERHCTEQGADGLAVLLTNASGLWTAPSPGRRPTRDAAFRLHQGRRLQGVLEWAEGAYPGNRRELGGSYAMDWRDYSQLDGGTGGQLRFLAVPVKPA